MKKLFFLASGMFAMGSSTYIIAGLLPGISAALGTSTASTAQGIAAFGTAYVICAPLFAVLLANKPAKSILVLALAIFSIGNLLTIFSASLSVYLLSRAIVGIGAGLYSPIAVAAATGMVSQDERGRALGLVWGANSAGAVIGVPVGIWISARSGWQTAIGLIFLFGIISLLGIATRKIVLRVSAPPSLSARIRLLGNRRVLSVIGITCLTAAGSLGLYSYVAPMQAGSANSLPSSLFLWGLGGLIGSTCVGHIVDRIGRPRYVMAGILAVLTLTLLSLPYLIAIPYAGLLPFLIWGAMGWATVNPQQHTLIGLQPDQSATLAALNGSAISLGGSLGAGLGGLAIANRFPVKDLPFLAGFILLIALVCQVLLIKKSDAEVPT